MSNVLVIAEHVNGALRKVTLPTITFGQIVADLFGGELYVLVLGDDTSAIAEEVSTYGVDRVFTVDHPAFANYLAENYTPAISAAVEELEVEMVCAPSSTFGKDLMPRVAAKLDAGMISDAIDVFLDEEDEVLFKRPLWADNVITTVYANTQVITATVRGTAFDAPEQEDAADIEALDLDVVASDAVEFVSFDQIKSDRPELTDADVIIAGGRGLKSADGFNMLMDLADLLGGAVGASRAAADSGYAPNDWQIGQTGKVVAPNLYVAVAISGAIQHLAGMKGSKTIVAINKDAEAPIFQVSDYGLVADAFTVVPELTEALKARGIGG